MDLRLSGRVAVVTGGASGIGRASLELLAAEGARAVSWDVAAEEIAAAERSYTVDITDAQQVARAVAKTEAEVGPIDCLVHAAAIGSRRFGFPFTNLSADDWRPVLEVNIMGLVHVAQQVAPAMRERRRGTMVIISSVAGQIGSQTDPPYSASKAANINFAQCMAKDLAPFGVRVNTVCPGMVQTPLNRSVWQAWHDAQPVEQRRSYEDWAGEKVRTVVPLGRWQQPQDIADMVVFLSSDRAGEITGQTINVDGGFVMHW